jgi:N-hydroxyarylamine O-acetyltransferase
MPTALDYLKRIGHAGSIEPTAEVLRALHRAHMLSVPFENLDIGLKRDIPCDAEAAVRKIVARRRGGFCYEMNGGFAWLLRQLGFEVTMLAARVSRSDGSLGPEFDHLTLRVDLAEPWLADVGFGDSFVEPLRLVSGLEQVEGSARYRLSETVAGMQLEKSQSEDWRVEYAFTLQPRELSDFAGMCHYHQTSPESHFTRNCICSRALPDGRITLSGMKLITTRGGKREERALASEEEWRETLRREFGVEL